MNRKQVTEQMCQLIPVAQERAVRGAELAVAGKVTQIAGSTQYFVAGRTDAFYVVDLAAGTCNCPDGRAPHDQSGRKLCKHVCAALLTVN